jgi:hypothetical protein
MKEFNGTTHFYSLPKRLKQCPLTLPSPAAGRGEKEDEKILTMLLHPTLSRLWRGEKEKEGGILFVFNC